VVVLQQPRRPGDPPQAEVRADQAADLLIELADKGQDVLVLAHGFFNWMIADAEGAWADEAGG
jgi:hypothetical protein